MKGQVLVLENQNTPSLVLRQEQVRKVQDDEILIKQTAIGLNHFDLLQYKNTRGVGQVPGVEACGYVEDIGAGVQGVKPGDRVAYATAPIGSFREYRCLNKKYVTSIPDNISDQMVAASLFKALTAHYLATRAFIIRPGVAVVIHCANSSVGQILAQIANSKGALVIGTVSDEEKSTLAQGCHYTVNYNGDWKHEILDLTKGMGVNAVYDSLGKLLFQDSLDILMKMGIIISYGSLAGNVTNIEPRALMSKSLFATFPSIYDYKYNHMELILSATDMLTQIAKKQLKVTLKAQYSLDEADKAMVSLASRKGNGSIILTV